MKKLLILCLAALIVVAFTLPAAAFESEFNGYMRLRAYSQQNFSGLKDDFPVSSDDLSRVDQRYRIGYRAILNDNLKFITNFEFNSSWGSQGTSGSSSNGAIGMKSDGAFLVRHAYIDFTTGPVRFTAGQQGFTFGRGFIIDDSALGVTASFKMGDALIPLTWFRGNEGELNNNAEDEDYVALWPIFNLGEAFTLNPFIVYGYSNDGGGVSLDFGENGFPGADYDGFGLYWIGANADASLGAFNLWGTFVYLGGNVDFNDASDADAKAWAAAIGANVPLGPASIHGQFFYWTGDNDPLDDDLEAFFGTSGVSYYWAEIMGAGMFDSQSSAGTNTAASNIWAGNLGATIQPMEKLSLTGDLWYASLVEKNAQGKDTLGFEVDLKATYQLVEGLSMSLVGAYLFADDAITSDGDDPAGLSNDEDPWEVGTQLSLSF